LCLKTRRAAFPHPLLPPLAPLCCLLPWVTEAAPMASLHVLLLTFILPQCRILHVCSRAMSAL
jgi:hypothetical protein